MTQKHEITAIVCGGKQARICRVTGKEHDMSRWIQTRAGGTAVCKDCGASAMELDMLELP